MPNWCFATVEVKGDTPKNVEGFCKHFLYDGDRVEHKLPKQYFARSFMNIPWTTFKDDHLGEKTAEFTLDFAWSAYSCLIEGYPDDKTCITLMTACRKHKVYVTIHTEEPGMCFEEHIECDATGKLVVDKCKDMDTYKCETCGEEQNLSSSDDEAFCYECDKIGVWTLVKRGKTYDSRKG